MYPITHKFEMLLLLRGIYNSSENITVSKYVVTKQLIFNELGTLYKLKYCLNMNGYIYLSLSGETRSGNP